LRGTLFRLQGAVFVAATRAGARHQTIRASLSPSVMRTMRSISAVRTAAARMVAQRLLLPQDARARVELAAQDRLSQFALTPI